MTTSRGGRERERWWGEAGGNEIGGELSGGFGGVLVSMTAGPARHFRALSFVRRPSGSHRGGRGLGVPDEILGLTGRNRAIGATTGCQILTGTPNRVIGGPIVAPTRDALIGEAPTYKPIGFVRTFVFCTRRYINFSSRYICFLHFKVYFVIVQRTGFKLLRTCEITVYIVSICITNMT